MYFRQRHGLTAIEVLVGVAILAALALPTWSLFVSGRGMAFKSKYAYLALIAAREEIDDLRLKAHISAGEPWLLRHDWQPVSGSSMGRLTLLNPRPDVSSHAYSKDQARIFTKLEVFPAGDGESWPAVLQVRWQEMGERMPDQGQGEEKNLYRFDVVLVKPCTRRR